MFSGLLSINLTAAWRKTDILTTEAPHGDNWRIKKQLHNPSWEALLGLPASSLTFPSSRPDLHLMIEI